MLGRSAGLSDAQLAALDADPLPGGVFAPQDAAIVRYARQSTLGIVVDDRLYADLGEHFTSRQIVDITLVVGLSNLINRFHATFHTDVDASTLATIGDARPLDVPTAPSVPHP